jgi:hypothetical protein
MPPIIGPTARRTGLLPVTPCSSEPKLCSVRQMLDGMRQQRGRGAGYAGRQPNNDFRATEFEFAAAHS